MDPKEQAKDHLQNLDSEKKDEILQSFDSFKNYLGDKVNKGEKLGLNDEQLAKTAQTVAGYLAEHEEPRNREEYLLKQLWKSGNEDQQHVLAHLLVNMVKKSA